jgi:biopolymer transport protein ExbD
VAQARQDAGLITGINVTPLVDVALVLLVILMVTASTIVSRTIPVDLPSAKTGEGVRLTLAISIDARDEVYLDGRPIGEPALRERIRTARARDPEARAVIAADGALPHRNVVHVVDVLRQEGISRFALSVAPEDLKAR